MLQNVKDPDSLKFDDKDKANILQKQFCSVFTKEQSDNLPTLEMRTDKKIEHLHITEEMVRKEILTLNINKSSGPDEICPIMLINLVDFVANPLALLMNVTINNGTLPKDWKKAFVSPIYKKGARNHAENYQSV